jgi:hypothetical protein
MWKICTKDVCDIGGFVGSNVSSVLVHYSPQLLDRHGSEAIDEKYHALKDATDRNILLSASFIELGMETLYFVLHVDTKVTPMGLPNRGGGQGALLG